MGSLPADFKPIKDGAVTGRTLAERWILHKMNVAAKEINQGLADREFSRTTISIYRYWYAELCDVYIENSKAIIRDGTEEERNSALQTLYTALEGALVMIHPYMPFITEDMWQRMPRRPDDSTKSIMVAKYTQYNPILDDPESEAAYELVLGCVKGTRSLMAEYSLKEEAQIKIHAYNDKSYQTCTEQLSSIKSLAGKGVNNVEIVGPNDPRPAGSVAYPVSTSVAVFLYVKGRVDIDAEIAKAQKKLDKATANAKRQEKIILDPGYKEKVSPAVQESDAAKLAEVKQEATSFQETIKQFEQLKVE